MNDVRFTLDWLFYLSAIMYVMILLPASFGIVAYFCSRIGNNSIKENAEQIGDELEEFLKAYKKFN